MNYAIGFDKRIPFTEEQMEKLELKLILQLVLGARRLIQQH